MSAAAARTLLVGAHGYGAAHLHALERLGDRVRLVGTVDPQGPPAGRGGEQPWWPDLGAALAAVDADVVIVATPTGTHASLAEQALQAGADVYLEKPPAATMRQFERLLEVERASPGVVQVGFQSLGSEALARLAEFGPVQSVATWGTWVRRAAYWQRSRWAGRRELDGQPVVDGAVTNPFAHAVATALRVAGARRREDVAGIDLELWHANPIEADDTSSVRVRLADGRVVGVALTLCAEQDAPPVVVVRAASGEARLSYSEDLLIGPDGRSSHHPRRDLFIELLERRGSEAPLTSSLADSGAFMQVLEAVRTGADPRPLPAAAVRWVDTGPQAHPVVADVEGWVERAAREAALFSEVGAPWARP